MPGFLKGLPVTSCRRTIDQQWPFWALDSANVRLLTPCRHVCVRVAVRLKELRFNSSLQYSDIFTILSLAMSQQQSQSSSASSSPFALLQYEQTLLGLPPLRDSIDDITDKHTARAWAEKFGSLMVRTSLFLYCDVMS